MATLDTMFPGLREQLSQATRAAQDAEYFAIRAKAAREAGDRGRALRLAKKAKAARERATVTVTRSGIC